MNRCGTQEVELYDGRMIGVDPTTADRLDHLLRASDLNLTTGAGGRSLYELRHMETKKQRQSHKERARVHG